MEATENALNWFEIAVNDMKRAKKFYEAVFEMDMMQREMVGMSMAFFPTDDSTGKVSGALVKSEIHTPGNAGALIYLNGNPDLALPLGRVKSAGGQVAMAKTFVSDEVGFMAFFIDSEGNRVGLHSFK